jgi:hypothetical protein
MRAAGNLNGALGALNNVRCPHPSCPPFPPGPLPIALARPRAPGAPLPLPLPLGLADPAG